MRNIKVLSLDGGGYRGLAIIEALAKLAAEAAQQE